MSDEKQKPELLKEIERLIKSGLTAKQAAIVAMGGGGLLKDKKKKRKPKK